MAAALLDHGAALANSLGGGAARFTADDRANAMIHDDPFAFLVAVIADQGIKAERAWVIPHELKLRLGGFSPEVIRDDPEAVRAAFATPPKLHRFVNQVADWISTAAEIVDEKYSGDAASIWAGHPSAQDLRARFDAFPGIGQKKTAMAVEILARDLGASVSELSGSDVAYDIHLRQVFLRTGLAERDDTTHMVAVARSLHPERPGELDNPAWDIGRRWCTAGTPSCWTCPLVAVCPRDIERARESAPAFAQPAKASADPAIGGSLARRASARSGTKPGEGPAPRSPIRCLSSPIWRVEVPGKQITRSVHRSSSAARVAAGRRGMSRHGGDRCAWTGERQQQRL